MDKKECKDCVYLEADGEIINHHIEKVIFLEAENKKLRKEIVGWMNWAYYLPKNWKPSGLLKTSKQVLKGESNGVDKPI